MAIQTRQSLKDIILAKLAELKHSFGSQNTGAYINEQTRQSIPLGVASRGYNTQGQPITTQDNTSGTLNTLKTIGQTIKTSPVLTTSSTPNVFTPLVKGIEQAQISSQKAAEPFHKLPPLEQMRQVNGYLFDVPIKFIYSALQAPKIIQSTLQGKSISTETPVPKWLKFLTDSNTLTSFQQDATAIKQSANRILTQKFPNLSVNTKENLSNGITFGLTALQTILAGAYTKWLGQMGAEYLQSFAPEEEHIAAWATLGYPKNASEIKTNYYNLTHEFYGEFVLGGDNAKIINNAYEILGHTGVPDTNIINTTLGKIGKALLSSPTQTVGILTGVPQGQVIRTQGLLPSQAGYYPTQPYQPIPQVVPVGLSTKQIPPERPIEPEVKPEEIITTKFTKTDKGVQWQVFLGDKERASAIVRGRGRFNTLRQNAEQEARDFINWLKGTTEYKQTVKEVKPAGATIQPVQNALPESQDLIGAKDSGGNTFIGITKEGDKYVVNYNVKRTGETRSIETNTLSDAISWTQNVFNRPATYQGEETIEPITSVADNPQVNNILQQLGDINDKLADLETEEPSITIEAQREALLNKRDKLQKQLETITSQSEQLSIPEQPPKVVGEVGIKPEIKPEKVKPEMKSVPKELEPLAEEVRKYKSAEEFAIKEFANPEKTYILEEYFDKGLKLNADGTVDLYHATTKDKANSIIKEGILRKPKGVPDSYGVYLSTSKEVAESYGDGTLVKVRVPFRVLNLDDAFPGRKRMDFRIETKNGIYQPEEIGFELSPKQQLTDFYNQVVKGIKPEIKPEKVKPEITPQPPSKIAPEAPESPTRGVLPEKGKKIPLKPIKPVEAKLEVVSSVTTGDKLDIDIEQDIKDQPITAVKQDGSEETLEIPTEPTEIYDTNWRKIKTTDPIAIMKWNEIKQNLDDLLKTFKQAIPDLRELKANQKELVSSLRDIQLARLDAIFAEAKDINEFKQRLGELSEIAGKSVSEKVQKLFDGDTLNKAFSVIQYFSGNDWLKLSALKAFLDLSTGHTAYASGYKAIAKIFGSEFALQIKQLFPLSTSEKVLYFISAVYNVPRSWLAGFFDLSATQVQLLLASSGHPILALKALGAGMKAFAEGFMHPSEQALAIQSIWQDPDMKRLVYEAKISFTNPFGVGGEKFQEPFIGLSILEKVPVVRRIVGGTAAAFDTQVSLMQYYLGKTYLNVLEATGEVTKENLESMGRFINDITGRANIPRSLKKITTVLNYGFFSPRMLIATFDTLNPVMYVKLPKPLRKYAARMWLAFLSLGFLKLFGARMFGAEDTTKDPTSADFLKIKIGNYRNNPFGKYQAIAVLLARIIKGEYTSTTTGMKQVVGWAPGYQGTSYAELITRFFASREHPTAAWLVDAIKGQTEEGLPFRWAPETLRLFVPMFFADTTELLYEARKNNWNPVLTLFATIDAFLGAPSQIYGGYIPAMFQDPNTGKYSLKLIQYPQTHEIIWSKGLKQPLTQFDPKDWEYVTNKYRADQAKTYLSKTFNSLMTQVENGKLTPDEAYKKWQEMTKALKIPISYTNTDPNNPYLQEYNRLLTKGEKVPTLDFKFYQGLDAQDIVGYNKNLDDLRNRALQAVISSPNYQKLPDEYKSKLLTNTINKVEQQYNLNCIKNILSNIPKEFIPDALIELKRSGLMTESIFNQLQQGL